MAKRVSGARILTNAKCAAILEEREQKNWRKRTNKRQSGNKRRKRGKEQQRKPEERAKKMEELARKCQNTTRKRSKSTGAAGVKKHKTKKKANQSQRSTQTNAVYVTIHSKTLKERVPAWSGCSVYDKGGSMKNVSVK